MTESWRDFSFFAGNPKNLCEKKNPLHYIVLFFFFFGERFAWKREKIKKQRLKENEMTPFSFFLFIYYLLIFTFCLGLFWLNLDCLMWYWVLIFWIRELNPVQLQLNLVRLVRKLCLVYQEHTYRRQNCSRWVVTSR